VHVEEVIADRKSYSRQEDLRLPARSHDLFCASRAVHADERRNGDVAVRHLNALTVTLARLPRRIGGTTPARLQSGSRPLRQSQESARFSKKVQRECRPAAVNGATISVIGIMPT
jgi:hypothetical protein